MKLFTSKNESSGYESMGDNLKELYDYCEIPKEGEKIFLSNYKSTAGVLKKFRENRDFQKFMNPAIIWARFFFSPEDSPYLYHYLYKNDLIKIIQSERFYIGKSEDMNDPQENTYSIKKFENIISKKSEKAKELFEKSDITDQIEDKYIWSFTKNPYSFAMQNYGDVCFEIDAKKAMHNLKSHRRRFCVDSESSTYIHQIVYPIKVCYDTKKQEECLNYLAYYFLKAVKEKNLRDESYAETLLNIYSIIFKNPLLSEEQEIRFVVIRPLQKGDVTYDSKLNGKPKIIESIDKSNLLSIIVNHRTDQWVQGHKIASIDDTIRDLKYVLKDNKFYNTKIKRTILPY